MENEKLSIKDLQPIGSTFVLSCNKKTYSLKTVDLNSYYWITENFGKQLENLLDKDAEGKPEKINIANLARVAWKLLTIEDKSDFEARESIDYDENGIKLSSVLGGATLLSKSILTADDAQGIMKAIEQTIVASNPPKSDGIIDSKKKKQIGQK